MNTELPPWALTYMRTWIDRLHLDTWKIDAGLALCVNSDPQTHGLCEQYPDVNECCITFRADIEDTPEWRKTIIHELLHAAHARLDHLVERALIPQIAEAAQPLATEVYHQHAETYIHMLTLTLYAATCALDYPDEHKEGA
jgi:hypothetical protein